MGVLSLPPISSRGYNIRRSVLHNDGNSPFSAVKVADMVLYTAGYRGVL